MAGWSEMYKTPFSESANMIGHKWYIVLYKVYVFV